MSAYALNALLSLFLLGALLWTVAVLWQAACDGHRRGRARVHRGTSWDRCPCLSVLDTADGRRCEHLQPPTTRTSR